MSHARPLDPRLPVEDAIARVLEAERAARLSVAQAQADAAALTEEARAAVRALEARTDRRVQRIRAAWAARAEHLVGDLDAQTLEPESPCRLDAADAAAIDRAVAQVAAALTVPES